MRILFMGTPDIAADSLAAVLAAGHDVCGVFTRADKPVGRKQIMTAPPVKALALQHDLPVFQPRTLKDEEIQKQIEALAPQLIVVVAYGRLLPPQVLAIPQYGAINLHVSLLPKYRGAAPIQWSVINGEKETGVTIMQLDEGLDTGDILRVAPVAIGENETSGELFERISALGAKTLLETIDAIAAGDVHPLEQDHTKATLAPPLTKEVAQMDFERAANALHHLVCGCNPWPCAYFLQDGKKIKVLQSRVSNASGKVGEVLSVKPLTVACKQGALVLKEVVPEGSRPMEGSAWAAGKRLRVGDIL